MMIPIKKFVPKKVKSVILKLDGKQMNLGVPKKSLVHSMSLIPELKSLFTLTLHRP